MKKKKKVADQGLASLAHEMMPPPGGASHVIPFSSTGPVAVAPDGPGMNGF